MIPVARNVWQPILTRMPRSAARRQSRRMPECEGRVTPAAKISGQRNRKSPSYESGDRFFAIQVDNIEVSLGDPIITEIEDARVS